MFWNKKKKEIGPKEAPAAEPITSMEPQEEPKPEPRIIMNGPVEFVNDAMDAILERFIIIEDADGVNVTVVNVHDVSDIIDFRLSQQATDNIMSKVWNHAFATESVIGGMIPVVRVTDVFGILCDVQLVDPNNTRYAQYR